MKQRLLFLLLLWKLALSTPLQAQANMIFTENYISPQWPAVECPLGGVQVKIFDQRDKLCWMGYADHRGLIEIDDAQLREMRNPPYRLALYHPRGYSWTGINWQASNYLGPLALQLPGDTHQKVDLLQKRAKGTLQFTVADDIQTALEWRLELQGQHIWDTVAIGGWTKLLPTGYYTIRVKEAGGEKEARFYGYLSRTHSQKEEPTQCKLVKKEGQLKLLGNVPVPPVPREPPYLFWLPSMPAPQWPSAAASNEAQVPWYTGPGCRAVWQRAWQEEEHYFPSATVLIQDFIAAPQNYPQNLKAPLALQSEWIEQAGKQYLGISLQAPRRNQPKRQIHIVSERIDLDFPHLVQQLQQLDPLALIVGQHYYEWRNEVNYRNIDNPWEKALEYFNNVATPVEKELVYWSKSGSSYPSFDSSLQARFQAAGIHLIMVDNSEGGDVFKEAWEKWQQHIYLNDQHDLSYVLRYLNRSHQPYLRDAKIGLELLHNNGKLQCISTQGAGELPIPQDFSYEGYSLALWNLEEVAPPLRVRLRISYRDAAGKRRSYVWKSSLLQPQALSETALQWRLLWALSKWNQAVENDHSQVDWDAAQLPLDIEAQLKHYDERLRAAGE